MWKLSFVVLTFVSLNAIGQSKAIQYKEAAAVGVRKEQLDVAYPAAVNSSDPSKSVFNGEEKRFQLNYIGMFKNLNAFLSKKGFNWGEGEVKCYNAIYFNQDGKIDYFMFNFLPNQIDSEKEKAFHKLLDEFVTTYKFPLTASTKFSIAGPVSYKAF